MTGLKCELEKANSEIADLKKQLASAIERAERAEAQNRKSLRDWFAGQALAGMMANSGLLNELGHRCKGIGETINWGISVVCYAKADALLARREVKP